MITDPHLAHVRWSYLTDTLCLDFGGNALWYSYTYYKHVYPATPERIGVWIALKLNPWV